MTRVVTGAAVLGIVQGVLVVLLRGPLGLSPFTGGWFSYSGSYSSSAVFTTVPRLAPRLGLPLVLAVVAAVAAALSQRWGWLGPRPNGGAVSGGRVGVAAVVVAAGGQALSSVVGPTVAFGPTLPGGSDRPYADYLQAGYVSPTWTVLGASVGAAVVLVLLTAVRENRVWGRRALVIVLLLGVAGVAVQLVLLKGPGLFALGGEVLALLLGVVALALSRRPSTA